MVCPAYFIQSGQVPLSVVWISLMIGCLVTGVIQANDIHDIRHDQASGIQTMARALGRRRAIIVYCGFYVAAYLVLLVSVGRGLLPAAALLPLALLPTLVRTISGLAACSRREGQIAGLLFWSAQFHGQFGLLLIGGLLLSGLFTGTRG
jgi:1,4-dihydroxy-2-naphthoate octaprenyltransferase